MPYSTDHFLTTHVGSLPRERDLRLMMRAREDGVPVDPAALTARVSQAVKDVVARQCGIGIDIVNDGEMSKASYATYVKYRLNGFGGGESRYVFEDLADFPALARRLGEYPSQQERHAPGCIAPLSARDNSDVERDIANLRAAVGGDLGGCFMTAASPGIVATFFRNEYYPSHEAYVFAIADALKAEYECIARSGATLQLDCPDLAMGRHLNAAGMTLPDFRRRAALHIEALNHATANIPPERMRMHLCWGNYRGPHHCDMEFGDVIDLVFKARPATLVFEAANPRHGHEWQLFETVKLPDSKVLCPGVIDCQSNTVEHPRLVAQRIKRYADLVGRHNVIAGTDCGFNVHVGHHPVDPGVVWLKLRSLVEGAAIASEWCF